jgi:hypothetical protein
MYNYQFLCYRYQEGSDVMMMVPTPPIIVLLGGLDRYLCLSLSDLHRPGPEQGGIIYYGCPLFLLSVAHSALPEQGGIIYSNWVTTVSPTYAREALDGGAAGWLRSTLAKPEVRAKFQVCLATTHFPWLLML